MTKTRWTWDTWAVFALAIAGGAVARYLRWVALRDVGHVMDEFAYVFQAKTFAWGRLTAPLALPRGVFGLWFVDDRWARFSIFPPGWPAVLALGDALRLSNWVNPALHAATVPALAAIGQRLGGTRARIVLAGLYALSPQALLLAASLMSHPLVAFASAWALAMAIAAVGERRPHGARLRSLLLGIALAVVILARPPCAVVVGIGLATLLGVGLHRKTVRPREVILAVAPCLAGVALLLGYNAHLTGSATRFPQDAWFDEHLPPTDDAYFDYRPGCNRMGLGPGHGCDRSIRKGYHDLENALSNTGDNLTSWAVLAGGGPLVFLLALVPLFRRQARAEAAGMLVFVGGAVVLYGLYWHPGTCYGARFYHAALPALLALAGLGLARWPPRACAAMAAVVLAGNAAGLYLGVSEISDHYWGTDERFAALQSKWDGPPSLVLLAFSEEIFETRALRWTAHTSQDRPILRNGVRAEGALGRDGPRMDDRVLFGKYHPALVGEM
ncbi:MAG TPA: hypothetical protein VNO21_25695, partial [Polyangiaceae bacterium]|nr:hypothetical protein [Polyangiaceae bacterium]